MENEDMVREIDDLDKTMKNEVCLKMIEQLFGYIKRGEDLQASFIQPFIDSKMFDYRHLTIKYLQSYLL